MCRYFKCEVPMTLFQTIQQAICVTVIENALTGAWTIHFPDNVSHASLVAEESCQMNRLGGIIFRERLHLTTMPLAPLLGQESQRAMSRGRELAMGLQWENVGIEEGKLS